MSDKKVLITGGGSGGHISAATAILDGLRARFELPNENILYIGSGIGMEGEKVQQSLEEKVIGASDIPFKKIRAGKLQRYFSWKSVKLLWGVVGGVIDSWKVIRDFRPDLIISTGGFVTVPIAFVGNLLKVPVYVHEQTAAVGLTNKLSSKFAKRVYTSFKSSAQYFPEEKVLHVGNAIRKDVFEKNDNSPLAQKVKKMSKQRDHFPILLFTGGGQGSHLINITVQQMLPYLLQDYQVVIQTGDNSLNRDYDELVKEAGRLDQKSQDRFVATKYINKEEIGYIFSQTDLQIGRSGANYVYEMAALRIPSIFIPIPWVTHNEQTKNAQALAQLGVAKVLPEGEVTAERLYNEIKKMMDKISSKNLKYSEKEIEEIFPTDAVEKIVADLEKEFI